MTRHDHVQVLLHLGGQTPVRVAAQPVQGDRCHGAGRGAGQGGGGRHRGQRAGGQTPRQQDGRRGAQ